MEARDRVRRAPGARQYCALTVPPGKGRSQETPTRL